MSVRFVRALVPALAAAALAGCGTPERRPDPVAGTFRLSSALHGDARVLALVSPGEDAPPLVLLADAPPGAAGGAPIVVADGRGEIADWRFASFGQGLYRIDNAAAGGRLSLAAGYGTSADGVELAASRRSAFQLWYVVPLADGRCRLSSALFPDASLDVGEDGRGPRLVPSNDDAPGQRWRFAPLADTSADGLPSLCGGTPRTEPAAG